MVMPIWDDNPFKSAVPPLATWTLIALNIVLFLTQVAAPGDAITDGAMGFGAIPAAVLHLDPVATALQHDSSGGWLRPELTLVTSMFLHGDLLHLLGNMLFLFVFGDNIEHALGRTRFVAFYLLCGIGATLAYVAVDPYSTVPLVGASGAIAGVVAAYAMIRPCAKVTVFVWRIVVRLRAYWVIGAWLLWQLLQIAAQPGDGVAYAAHLGGFVLGIVLLLALKGPDVVLFVCADPGLDVAEGPQDAR